MCTRAFTKIPCTRGVTIEVIRLFLTDTDHDDYIITLTTAIRKSVARI